MATITNNDTSLFTQAQLCGQAGGKDVYDITMHNEMMRIGITNLGCAITAIYLPDREGQHRNIVAGFEHPLQYQDNPYYFGTVVGRYANRIGAGQFQINGVHYQLPVNDGINHLHGGVHGFHQQVWMLRGLIQQSDETGVIFEYVSADGEEGYPGMVRVQVQYTLNQRHELVIRYRASSDKRTPINLTNHSYFNLSGFERAQVTDHSLYVCAGHYTEKNDRNLPTGRVLPVADTSLDFRTPRLLSAVLDDFPADRGLDHNFVLEPAVVHMESAAAELYDSVSGRQLTVYTSCPGMQVYTANWWDGTLCGQQGKPYEQHGAVALETQYFPDSPNHEHFPDTILRPGVTYESTTVFVFGLK
ncbi:galactose mutarotase [Chitinophaga pendula]|uniref:aldose epimerase family protein n=1 Tax=Chitinophaga TaxID=79328 RepID=UPI000BAF680F|nr:MULTISPECIES: aldose epimerase family protein [Chitinophaga]ASZ11112.1 galactose-1-epimerase [Chitinophaga sp. MD30]UCJ05890.1 galactose mutarotase [Chitinophaga pendula]